MKLAIVLASGAVLAVLAACTPQPLPYLPPGGTAIYVPPPPPPPPPPPVPMAAPAFNPAPYAGLPEGTTVYRRSRSGRLYYGAKRCPAGMYWQGTRRVLVEGTNQSAVVRGKGRCVKAH